MEEEGNPFFPALSCDRRACGGSCTVCVSPRPGRPVEDRGGGSDGHTEASLELLGVRAEGVQAFFFFFLYPLLVSQVTWEGGLGCCPPSSPSLTARLHGGGSWGAGVQGPGTGDGECGSHGREGGLPEDNSGGPPRRLAGDHSPHSGNTPHGSPCP